tara:strand:- start:1128 stop:2873 length:1746 start_codon:yes stop_codon:yes gene_type:complete
MALVFTPNWSPSLQITEVNIRTFVFLSITTDDFSNMIGPHAKFLYAPYIDKMVLDCRWNEPIPDQTLEGIANALLNDESVTIRLDGLPNEALDNMSMEMRTQVRGAPITHRNAWKDWNRPGATPPATGHAQLTSVLPRPNDVATNALWDGICNTLHGFSDAVTGVTIVGNALPPTQLPYATPAHYHAPPVINVAIKGACFKEYIFVRWDDATDAMRTSTRCISEVDMRACRHTEARIGVSEGANVIIFPARMFHLIKTVNPRAESSLYLGFGTYFLLRHDGFIDDAIAKMGDAMRLATWWQQLGRNLSDASHVGSTMQANWASCKTRPAPMQASTKCVRQTGRQFLLPQNSRKLASLVANAVEAHVDTLRQVTNDTIDPIFREFAQRRPDITSAASANAAIDSIITDLQAAYPMYIFQKAVVKGAIDRILGGAGSSGSVGIGQAVAPNKGKRVRPENCFICHQDLTSVFSVKCDNCDLMACKHHAGFANEAHFRRYERTKKKSWRCSTHGNLRHCTKCGDPYDSCEHSKVVVIKGQSAIGCEYQNGRGDYVCSTWLCMQKCAGKPPGFVGTWYCDVHQPPS